jgi:hypothetical protein
MRQPTIHQMREKKNHRGKVKEVETVQYFPLNHFCICLKLVNLFDT